MSKIRFFFLDRPSSANAFDVETALKLQNEVKAAVKKQQSGVVLTSRNSKIFCSGGNLKNYAQMKTKAEGAKANSLIRGILGGLALSPLLVVAAIEGDCVGGGCELALACDMIIAGETARFSFRQSWIGLTPGWNGAKNLSKRVNASTALEWCLSGRWISAPEAVEKGFVDKIVTHGNAADAAEKQILANRCRPELIGAYKKIFQAEGKNEEKIFNSLWFTSVHREALRAALEKTKGRK